MNDNDICTHRQRINSVFNFKNIETLKRDFEETLRLETECEEIRTELQEIKSELLQLQLRNRDETRIGKKRIKLRHCAATNNL